VAAGLTKSFGSRLEGGVPAGVERIVLFRRSESRTASGEPRKS
jgi:hypothetical protein